MPVVLWFHGANGSGTGALRNAAMTQPFLDRGYAFVAADGLLMPGRDWTNWALRDGREPWRDELAFALQILDDVDRRYGIDRDRVLVAGFSRGASLVWDLACHDAEHFTAFAPVAGAFWRPHPETCESGPIDLLHTHGFQDGTVPLEGRPLRSERAQGDVFEGLALLRRTNQCGSDRADTYAMSETFWCKAWTECDGGTELELCLHQAGHGVPQGWSEMAVAWFEGLQTGGAGG